MRKLPILVLAIVVLAGCNGVLEVGIERTPTPDIGPAATLEALLSDNSRLATRVAAMATPTSSVPPNLGRLAYVQGGDVWVKALPSGTPLRLTTDGLNREPRWSPSGEWLAFRKQRQVTIEREVPCEVPRPRPQICTESVPVTQKQVWVIGAEGDGAHPLSQGASVEAFAWSPVDDRLAYSTAVSGLNVINADGTDLVTLVPYDNRDNPGRLGRFAWNPEGTLIAYEWRIQSTDQSSTYQGLWKVSMDGNERVELYASGLPKKGEALLAGWSPLGKRVIFWQSEVPTASLTDGTPLYAINATPSKDNEPARLGAGEVVLNYFDFIAPAPRNAVLEARDAIALVTGNSRSTWKNKRIELSGRILSPQNMAAISPAWSPTGARLVYAAMPERADLVGSELARQELMQRHIWVASVLGEPQFQRLTDSASYRDEHPLWSADGSHILFARLDAKGRASVWIMAEDGGSQRQVVDELTPAPDPPIGFYGHVEWEAWFDWWRGL
jgi:Tol biopolymer transport system component